MSNILISIAAPLTILYIFHIVGLFSLAIFETIITCYCVIRTFYTPEEELERYKYVANLWLTYITFITFNKIIHLVFTPIVYPLYIIGLVHIYWNKIRGHKMVYNAFNSLYLANNQVLKFIVNNSLLFTELVFKDWIKIEENSIKVDDEVVSDQENEVSEDTLSK